MCRLFGFRSSVLSGVHTSLVAAENALADQSVRHPDGWGVAYYHGRFPHLIRNDEQALADGLFRELSGVVATHTLLAHIRQATVGKVGILNCHPFQFGPWCFAHNGQIANYGADEGIRARVNDAIDPRFRRHILGSTDSEACFYLFLSRLGRRVEDIYHQGIRPQVVVDALQSAVDVILDASSAPDPDEPNRLTFLVTNGSVMVGVCYKRPLVYSTHKSKCPEADTCHAYEAYRCEQEVSDGLVKHMVLSSEEITGANVWIELGQGEYVATDAGMNFRRGSFASLRASH